MPPHHSEDRGGVLIGVGVAFIILELLAFGLRITARWLRRVPFGFDDALMFPALVLNLALCIMGIVSVPYAGVGRHLTEVEAGPNAAAKLKFFGLDGLLIIPLLSTLAVAFSKASIASMFLRIFPTGPARTITWIVYVVIVGHAIASALTLSLFTIISHCDTISQFWDDSKYKRCVRAKAFFQYSSIPNVSTDLVMLVLPLHTIWTLKSSTRVKAGLTITVLTASLGIIVTIVRMVEFFKANNLLDATWLDVNLIVYTIAEPGTYFLAACFPTYRPLITYLKRIPFISKILSRFWSRGAMTRYTNTSDNEILTVDGGADSNREGSNRVKRSREFDSVVLSNIERDTNNSK